MSLIGLMPLVLVTHLVVDRTSRLSTLLSWPPLVGIGQVSSELYLWHWVWLQYPLVIDRGTPVQLLIAVALAAVSVLVTYCFVELPALRLKQRLTSRREPEATSAAAERSDARVLRRNL